MTEKQREMITAAAGWWEMAVTHTVTGRRQYSDAQAPARLRDALIASLNQECEHHAKITDLTVDYQPVRLLEHIQVASGMHVFDFPPKTVMLIRWYNNTIVVISGANETKVYPDDLD